MVIKKLGVAIAEKTPGIWTIQAIAKIIRKPALI